MYNESWSPGKKKKQVINTSIKFQDEFAQGKE